MKQKKKLMRMAMTFALALVMVAGALPGVTLKAHASSAEETWRADQTIESTKTINDRVDVEEDVDLTINKGVTLTINNGLYIYDGAALTVKGEGTLVVNGHNGSKGNDDWGEDSLGGNGSDGKSAINGNIIVEGGKVTVTGGRGGSGGYGNSSGGDGGYGGYGINGNLTVKGGSVTVTGGTGGTGGSSPIQTGSDGSNAKAINGNISGATGLVAEESEDSSIWNYITGGSSEHQFVRAKVLEPVKVKIDVGAGHAALFTSDVLNAIKTEFELSDATISGNIITLKGVDPSNTEYEMWSLINVFVDDLVEPTVFHNEELFMVPGYKSIDEYATRNELFNDVYDNSHSTTPVSDNMTYYLIWAKPYKKLDLDNGNPTCGKEWWKAFPTVPEGFMVDEVVSHWVDENDEPVETFEGGKTYTFSGRIQLNPYGALWRYFLDPNNFTLTVKDGKDVNYNVDGEWITVTFKATADHDWDAGTVTKQPTCTESGEKAFKCRVEGCDGAKTEPVPAKGHDWGEWTVTTPATADKEGEETRTCKHDASHKETRAIPKLVPDKKPVLTAKGIANGKKAAGISWNKVKGAAKYEIWMSKCGSKMKKVKTLSSAKTKWTNKKLAKKTTYKFCVVAKDAEGKVISRSLTGHFISGNVRGRYTNAKSLKLGASSAELKKGETFRITAKQTKAKKGKKLLKHAALLRYVSDDTSVATVDAKGIVTAVKAGSCKVYVFTVNGISKSMDITVK